MLELTRWFNSNSPLLIGVATGVPIVLMVLLFVLERHYFWIPYIVGASIASKNSVVSDIYCCNHDHKINDFPARCSSVIINNL
ncbi:hypothetical protein MGH68_14275 [Erysipelothrix sp. D19-032]